MLPLTFRHDLLQKRLVCCHLLYLRFDLYMIFNLKKGNFFLSGLATELVVFRVTIRRALQQRRF